MLEAAFTLRLLHSPSSPLASVGFPFLSALQCCISLFSFHLFQHFHISCYSEFSSLAPSPSLKVQPSFLLSFLFLVVSDLYFLRPSAHRLFLNPRPSPGCCSTSAPVILEQPSDTVVARGEPVTLNCKVRFIEVYLVM